MKFLEQSYRYSTLTEAITKMNFEGALENQNCFPFICNVCSAVLLRYGVIDFLFFSRYWF